MASVCEGNMEYKTLNNGVKMPIMGIGVYDIPERETQRVVEDAVSVGYRSIDTGHNVTGWPSDALTYKVTDR